MLAVGTVVALVSDLAPWIATYGVAPEDLRQQDPEFYQQFGFLPKTYFRENYRPLTHPLLLFLGLFYPRKKIHIWL